MRERWFGVVAVVLVAIVAMLIAVDGSRLTELNEGDSTLLVRGSFNIEHCLSEGRWTDCGGVGVSEEGQVGAWALAQYLIAVPLVALGVDYLSILAALAIVSGLAVVGMLALIAFPVRRLVGSEWAVVLAAAIVTGPFVLYSILPFGEALGAFLAFAFTVAACCRRPVWIFALALLAGVTKETAAPLLLLLGLACARTAADRYLPPARLLLPLIGGLLAAVAANLLFNVFRFGTTSNIYYNRPITRVPGFVRRLKLAVSDWFAPNVGVLWFWFLAGLIIAGLVVATGYLVVRHRRQPVVWLPPLAVVGCIALFTAGLASWYGTFGWVAWGPRLTIPLIPAFLLAGVWTAREPMTRGLQWTIRHPVALAAVTVGVVVLAIPQVGVVWNREAIRLPLVPDAACPVLYPIEQTTPEYFYGCGLDEAWRLDPLSLREAARGGTDTQLPAEVLLAVAVVLAAVWLHRRAGTSVERDAPSDQSSESLTRRELLPSEAG